MTTMEPTPHTHLLCSTSSSKADTPPPPAAAAAAADDSPSHTPHQHQHHHDEHTIATSSSSSFTGLNNQQLLLAASSTTSTSWLQLGLPHDAQLLQPDMDHHQLDLTLGGLTHMLQPPPPPPNYEYYHMIPPSLSNNLHHHHHNHMMMMMPSSYAYNHHPYVHTHAHAPCSSAFPFNNLLLHPGHGNGGGMILRPPDHHLWFMLQASLHQSRQPILPQLSKSFLRIKDGRRMTVGLVMKYLANKLGLRTHSQVEIRCRGQVLEPYLTLEHVRDHIWNQSDAVVLLPNSSTSPHLMLLHYATT